MKNPFQTSPIMLIIFAFLLITCNSDGHNLEIDKSNYMPGEKIIIEYTADPNWNETAWIGIIPSNVAHGKESENDANDLYYQYLKKSDKGVMEFSAPNKAGKYDIRMHDNDDGLKGLEIFSVSFTVK